MRKHLFIWSKFFPDYNRRMEMMSSETFRKLAEWSADRLELVPKC